MRERIREAFDRVHAEQERKDRTLAFLAERTQGFTDRRRALSFPRQLAAAACLLLALGGVYWFCLVPTAEISIDINPSIELAVNRLDRVIAIEGRNDDGQQLADTLRLRFTGCSEAVEAVLESPQVAALAAKGEPVTITIVGGDEGQCARMLSQVESCTAQRKNTYCCSAHPQEVSQAHEAGLSCGKYRAFLELQRLDPDATVEEVRGMTMGELLRRIESLSPEGEARPWPGNGRGHAHHSHRED